MLETPLRSTKPRRLYLKWYPICQGCDIPVGVQRRKYPTCPTGHFGLPTIFCHRHPYHQLAFSWFAVGPTGESSHAVARELGFCCLLIGCFSLMAFASCFLSHLRILKVLVVEDWLKKDTKVWRLDQHYWASSKVYAGYNVAAKQLNKCSRKR